MNKDNELDLFFNATKIEKGQEPYDTIVKTKTSIKYVQLTTMNNLVSGAKQKNSTYKLSSTIF